MSEEVEEYDQERIDRTIWRHIGRKSVSEIAKMTGLKPEQVLRRKGELIESVDVLTVHEKRVKLMSELEEIAANARERYERVSDEFASGLLNSAVSAMKTVLAEMARIEKNQSGEIQKLNALRLREITRLIDQVVILSVREIAAKHRLDEDELLEVFQGNLVTAAREIEE